jgi:hypothetical protein
VIPALKTSQIRDRILAQLQQFVAQWAAPVTACQLIGGIKVTATFTAAASDTFVLHNLGTQSFTYIEGDKNAPGMVYRSPNQSPTPSQTVLLRATEPMTATLWFFEV